MGIEELFEENEGVLDAKSVRSLLTPDALRAKIAARKWQRPARGIIVNHSGPLTQAQALRVAVLWGGPRAALGGLTAAWLSGFKGFDDKKSFAERPVHLLVPRSFNTRQRIAGLEIVVRYTRALRAGDVHPAKEPRQTRIARSLIDAAEWMATDRGAMAVLAAGVQQRVVRVDDLLDTAKRYPRLRRRVVITEVLADIEGGAQALSELDFTRQVVRGYGLPEPDRQMARRDSQGRRRWIDVAWDEYKVLVEIDGAQHMEAQEYWDDMERGNELVNDGYRLLRFPGWVVRRHPDRVAASVCDAGVPGNVLA